MRRYRLANQAYQYHLGVCIQLRDIPPDAIDIDIDFMRIRRRNVLRSPPLRIIRGGGDASAAQPAEEETCDADVNEEADNTDLAE